MKKQPRKHQKNQYKQLGQSIIEVLIATLIVGTVLTAVASGLTLSIRNTSETRQRELATNFAQEGLEVFRRERDIQGWTSFVESLDSATYCLNNVPSNSTEFRNLPQGACSEGTAIAGSTLTRTATIQQLSADTVEVAVTVSWDESGESKTVTVIQEFKNLVSK